jgi:hypothetical protein
MRLKFVALKMFDFDCEVSFKVLIKSVTNFGHFEKQ